MVETTGGAEVVAASDSSFSGRLSASASTTGDAGTGSLAAGITADSTTAAAGSTGAATATGSEMMAGRGACVV